MTIGDDIADQLAGEEAIYDFSTLGLGFLILLIGVSTSAGLVSRRILFPRIMDLFSKTERIDGRTLFAPRSLGWMVGLLVMWQSLDWLLENVSVSGEEFIWNNGVMETVS